ncbi:MAG: ankyrin repeat domain-containing protein, partial [bacterium]|nr:ankyrin repeat domain-containing protein [bacterium]
MAKLLVQHGADMDYTSNSGWSILSMAIFSHKNKIGRLLIENGVDLDPPNKKIRRKPLWIAVKKKNQLMLKMLLERGVATPMYDIEKAVKPEKSKPYSLLHYALRYDNYEGAKLLIKGHGKVKLPEDMLDGEPFISNYCLMDIKRLLTRRKLEAKGRLNPNPIVQAVEQAKMPDAVSELINRYPDWVNRADDRGVTPLIAAIEARRKDLVERLLLEDADPDNADYDGIPPLTIALSLQAYDIARQLVKAGAGLHDSGCHGESVFYYAIKRNDIKALKLILRDKEAINRL